MTAFASSKVLGVRLPEEIADGELIRLHGHEGVSELFEFRLLLTVAGKQSIVYERVLGREIGVTLGSRAHDQSAMNQRHLHGIVAEIVEQDRARNHEYRSVELRVVPHVWGLTQSVRRRIFQERTIPQILEEVLAGTKFELRLLRQYSPHSYCVQYGESDFDFASRLMEEDGIFYFFEHTENGHRMVITDAVEGAPSIPNNETLHYRPDIEAGGYNEWVERWTKQQGLRPTRFAVNDYSFELPTHNLRVEHRAEGELHAGSRKHKLGLAEAFPGQSGAVVEEFPGRFAQRFDSVHRNGDVHAVEPAQVFALNRQRARDRAEESVASGFWIDAESNCTCVVPGYRFKLSGHEHADGGYFITRVEHDVEVANPRLPATAAPKEYSNRFRCLPIDWMYRPPRRTPRPRTHGSETAVVIGPAGDEISTDIYGRVRVRFPWDLRDDSESGACWIRVAQPWAGKNYGFYALPRIGSEVVVDYIDGDPDRPIIVGSVYNAEQPPPFGFPEERMVTGLKSRTYHGDNSDFHGMYFDDTGGEEMIRLRSQRDVLLEAKNEVQVEAPHGLATRCHGYHLHMVGGLARSSDGSGAGGDAIYASESISTDDVGSGAGGDAGKKLPDWVKVPNAVDGSPFVVSVMSTLGCNNMVTTGFNALYNILSNSLITVDPTTTNFASLFRPLVPKLGGLTGNNLITHASTAMCSYGDTVQAARGSFIQSFQASATTKTLAGLHALAVTTAGILPNLQAIPKAKHYALSLGSAIAPGVVLGLQWALVQLERKLAIAEETAKQAQQAVADQKFALATGLNPANDPSTTLISAVSDYANKTAKLAMRIPQVDAANPTKNQLTHLDGAWGVNADGTASMQSQLGTVVRCGPQTLLANATGVFVVAPECVAETYSKHFRAVLSESDGIAFVGAPGLFKVDDDLDPVSISHGLLASPNQVVLNRFDGELSATVGLHAGGVTIGLFPTNNTVTIEADEIKLSMADNSWISLKPDAIVLNATSVQITGIGPDGLTVNGNQVQIQQA